MENLLYKYGVSERFINEALLYPNLQLARIITQYKDIYKIVTKEKETYGKISGKFKYNITSLEQFPAVGDFVMVSFDDSDENNAIIHKVLTRKSIFKRPSVRMKDEMQPIATNVDTIFICMSLNDDYNLNRLERYVALSYDSNARPIIVLTKADTSKDINSLLFEVSNTIIGCDVIVTSMFDSSSYEKLTKYINKETTASFIGSSGVGKSTLINLLLEKEILKTNEIRENDSKGKHTSTNRQMIPFKNGGVLIDTPGMRELSTYGFNVEASFSDIEALAQKCKFRNCTHINEPDCAVKKALESGTLDKRRYENFIKLRDEANYEGLNSKQIEKEKINRMFGSKNKMKSMKKALKNKY